MLTFPSLIDSARTLLETIWRTVCELTGQLWPLIAVAAPVVLAVAVVVHLVRRGYRYHRNTVAFYETVEASNPLPVRRVQTVGPTRHDAPDHPIFSPPELKPGGLHR